MNEIKIGRIHYILDEVSGFWIAQHNTDPHSATITISELVSLVEDLRHTISLKQEELNNFIKYHTKDTSSEVC